jgi:hypothetical protein
MLLKPWLHKGAGAVQEVFVPPGDIMQFHDWAPVKREFAAGRIERGSD